MPAEVTTIPTQTRFRRIPSMPARSTLCAAARRSLLIAVALAATTAVARGREVSPVQRVDALLGQLTQDEKISLLSGIDSMFTKSIDRLGIPRLKMTDGPNGTRVWGKSTAYPAGILLAA